MKKVIAYNTYLHISKILAGCNLDEMDEDEMLMRAIAMSLEEVEVVKEELGSINVQAPGEPLKKHNQAITFISSF